MEIGDVVQLKSGSHFMTVCEAFVDEKTSLNFIRCVWIVGKKVTIVSLPAKCFNLENYEDTDLELGKETE